MQCLLTALTQPKQPHSLCVSTTLQLLHRYYSTKIAPKILQTQVLALTETLLEWSKREYTILLSPLGEERSNSIVRTSEHGFVVWFCKAILE